MLLKDYVENLNKLIRKHPEAKELEVITSRDDEGNGYNPVHFPPDIVHFNKESQEVSEAEEGTPANAVCVN